MFRASSYRRVSAISGAMVWGTRSTCRDLPFRHHTQHALRLLQREDWDQYRFCHFSSYQAQFSFAFTHGFQNGGSERNGSGTGGTLCVKRHDPCNTVGAVKLNCSFRPYCSRLSFKNHHFHRSKVASSLPSTRRCPHSSRQSRLLGSPQRPADRLLVQTCICLPLCTVRS